MQDILSNAREEALYNLLGKCMNEYIAKNPMPPYRIIRILTNMILQIVNQGAKEK